MNNASYRQKAVYIIHRGLDCIRLGVTFVGVAILAVGVAILAILAIMSDYLWGEYPK
jgi:hypothetical protein